MTHGPMKKNQAAQVTEPCLYATSVNYDTDKREGGPYCRKEWPEAKQCNGCERREP